MDRWTVLLVVIGIGIFIGGLLVVVDGDNSGWVGLLGRLLILVIGVNHHRGARS